MKKKKTTKKKVTRKKTINKKKVTTKKKVSSKKVTTKKKELTKKKKLPKIKIVLLIILFLLLSSYYCIYLSLDFNLNGSKISSIEVFDNYIEEGYNIKLFNKDVSNKVVIDNKVNTNKIGSYYITYNFKVFIYNYKIRRTINVIDTVSPNIELNGNNKDYTYLNKEYNDLGVTAIDNYDGDISNNVKISSNIDITKKGLYTVTYEVSDSSNNTSSIERLVQVIEKESDKNSCMNTICAYLKENNYNVSLAYYNLITGDSYYYNKDKLYYGASLIKTLDAIYLYDKGDLNSKLKSHIKKAIEVSNNDSHQYLVSYIGRDNLKKYGISLGAKNTLNGSDNYGSTTVYDQVIYMKKAYELSKTNEEFKNYFLNAIWNYIKIDNIPTMCKYGQWGSNFHQSGIILDEEPYILVILSNYNYSSDGEEIYPKYQNIFKNISNNVYEYHQSKK